MERWGAGGLRNLRGDERFLNRVICSRSGSAGRQAFRGPRTDILQDLPGLGRFPRAQFNRRGAMTAAQQSRNQKDRSKTESWEDRIRQREEKPEPRRMMLSGHDSVFRSSCGPTESIALPDAGFPQRRAEQCSALRHGRPHSENCWGRNCLA